MNPIKLQISKSTSFYWTPTIVPHRQSMLKLRYRDNGYDGTNFLVPTLVQYFWLWFILSVRIELEPLSTQRMMRYQDTINAELDELIKPSK